MRRISFGELASNLGARGPALGRKRNQVLEQAAWLHMSRYRNPTLYKERV